MAEMSHVPLTTFSRQTKDGRTLRYEMAILQQPQRARACGAGAKSSADRRPVDPPPVVELKIYDGEQDITFNHNASFFLYTTLESARPIAIPKGGATPVQTPVLTGTPVAGMAYLDRPSHAGYFIFPDLSVRHEGMYKLSFNLFEETKVHGDLDAEEPPKDHPSAKLMHWSPSNPLQCVNFRLEVKSEAFNVYSAKKFPGLTESTLLSRQVAEQGCRVRIRRDIRIRVRKDIKSSSDKSYKDESSEPFPVDHTALDQARSSHNGSVTSSYQGYSIPESKMSSHEQTYIKQSPSTQHMAYPPQQQPHNASHLNFGAPSQQQQQQQQYPAPPPPQYAHQPYPAATVHQQQQQTAPHSRQNSSSSSNQDFVHNQVASYNMSPYQHSTSSTRENTTNTSNGGYIVEIEPPVAAKPPTSRYYTDHRTQTPASITQSMPLPPLKTLHANPLLASSPSSYDPSPSTTSYSASGTKSKRGYSTVFASPGGLNAGAVQYGARPETATVGEELPMVETEEHGVISEDQLAAMKNMLSYRRADGTRHLKQIPRSQML